MFVHFQTYPLGGLERVSDPALTTLVWVVDHGAPGLWPAKRELEAPWVRQTLVWSTKSLDP